MLAYIDVFTRTKMIDEKELNIYRKHIRKILNIHLIEGLIACGKHETLEGNPIEGIVIAKFSDKKAAMS